MSGTGEVIALGLTLGVHVLGALLLIVVLFRGNSNELRDGWDDDDEGPPRGDPEQPAPRPGGGGGVPLPDAAPSGVRLREPGVIAGGYPRPSRRPEHPPQPAPGPARVPGRG